MRKMQSIVFTLIITSTFLFVIPNVAISGEKKIIKLVLGTFDIKNDKIAYTAGDPAWKSIDRKKVAIDDNENIYVLNKRNNSVLLFDENGKRIGEVILKEQIKKGYFLQVTGNGNTFIVGEGLKTFLFNRNGNLIQTYEEIIPSELRRLCDGTFVDRYGQVLYDDDLNVIKKGNFARFAEQYTGELEIPDELQFSEKYWTKEDWYEMEGYSSEEPMAFYKLSCKRNVFVIYALHNYPTNAYRKWLNGKEYFIYKIMMNE